MVQLYSLAKLRIWKNKRTSIQFNFLKLNLPSQPILESSPILPPPPLKSKRTWTPLKKTKKFPNSLGGEDTMIMHYFFVWKSLKQFWFSFKHNPFSHLEQLIRIVQTWFFSADANFRQKKPFFFLLL